jgi:hypothetical protein
VFPPVIDGGMLDEPAVSPALTDERSASFSFQQCQLSEVVTICRIGDTHCRVDHDSLS